MKRRQFIILGIILVILGAIYAPILVKSEVETEKSAKELLNYVGVRNALNRVHSNKITSYGQVMPNNQIDVSMKVQGYLENSTKQLKPGMKFKKNEILFEVNKTDALYNILSRRSSFTNLISSTLADIKLDFSSEFYKWEDFLKRIDPIKPLPAIPYFNSDKEKLFIYSRNIPSEYYAIKALENQLENYFYLAPFDGSVINSFVEPGSMVSPGLRLATISKTNDFEIKAPVQLIQIELFENADSILITDAQNKFIGYAKLVRISDVVNQQTQSVDAYFTIISPSKNIIQGMYVNVIINTEVIDECVVLPENAIINSEVQILNDSMVSLQRINVVNRKADSVFVSGITNGTQVLLEPLTTLKDSVKYIGIAK